MKTLKRDLMQVKNRIPEQKQTRVVYEVPCKDCLEVYVGETKRTLKVRLSEHRQTVRRGDPKNSIASTGIAQSPKTSRRVLAEEDCGNHPNQKFHPKHEPLQRPTSPHVLKLNPEPTHIHPT